MSLRGFIPILLFVLSPYHLGSAYFLSCPIKEEYRSDCLEICGHPAEIGPYDAGTFVTMGPVCIFLSSILIIGFCMFREMRVPPGNIILAISVVQLFQGVQWFYIGFSNFFLTKIKGFTCQSDNADWQKYCEYSGTMMGSFQILEIFFNLSFISYIACSARWPHYIKKIPQFIFIGTPVLILGIWMGFFNVNERAFIRPQLFGVCSTQPVCEYSLFEFAGTILLSLLLFRLVRYVKQGIPESNRELRRFRTVFLSFYFHYIITCIVIWVSLASLNLLTFVDFGECTDQENFKPRLYATSKLYNTIQMIGPLVLTILRLQDPYLKRKIGQFLGHDRSAFTNNLIQKTQPLESFVNFTQHFQCELQTMYTISILKCLSQQKKKALANQIYGVVSSVEDNDFLEVEQIEVEDESVGSGYVGSFVSNVDGADKGGSGEGSFIRREGMNCIVEIFAPKVFDHVMIQDEIDFDVGDSLSVGKNQESIREAINVSERGGRSGEFFFFSYDSNLIVKTVREVEKLKLLDILKDYYNYLKQNPGSKIARIYGLYSITGKQTGVHLNIILMRNIIGVPKSFILRRFDVKGSSKDRQVLKDPNLSEKQIRKIAKTAILKDLDLMKLEPVLALNSKDQGNLIRTLVGDSNFFKEHGLMDYSLFIAVVLHPPFEKSVLESGTNHVFQKEDQEDVFYHIGIIDYLQTYDAKKRIERTLKQFGAMSSVVDISASPPDHYAARFQCFVARILGQNPSNISSNFSQIDINFNS